MTKKSTYFSNEPRNSQLIEILNQISIQLIEVKNESEIYKVLIGGIKQILPNTYFLISKLQSDDKNFRIVESFGFENYFNAIKKIVGKDPFLIDFPFKNLTEEQFDAFESRKIYHFPRGIYDIVNGVINKTICVAIEKLINISDLYAISFCVEKKYFGGISFFIPAPVIKSGIFNRETKLAIETISNQASFLIQKLRDKKTIEQKNEELSIRQTRFNNLVSNLTDIVWRANIDGSGIEDINNSFEKFYGVSIVDFHKNPKLWIELVHPEDRNIALESNNNLFKAGSSSAEYRILKPDGSIIWLHDRKSLIYDIAGNPIEMGGIASDITQRKLLEEELKIKNYALDAAPVAVGLSDLNGLLIFANKAFVNLWGFHNQDEIIGKHISTFATSADQVERVLKTIREGKMYYGAGKTIRPDGTKFDSIISATLINFEERPRCLMAMFTDITELKLLETKLKEKTEQLERVNKTKDKFFNIIAHDLRSPFNGILGFSNLLSNEYDELSDEQRKQYIDILNYSVNNMYKLLGNLLNWARLQLGTIDINIERINLKNLVNDNIGIFFSNAKGKNITILNLVSEEMIIFADLESINTVLRNLLNNAIKFTPNGGKIFIDSFQNKNVIEIAIKDTGVGMEQITIDNLFKLEEIKSTPGTNNEKGTGLGLLLCKELIEKNGGVISVESEPRKGSTFKIKFLISNLQH